MDAFARIFAVCCFTAAAISYPSLDAQAPAKKQDDAAPVKGWLILEGGGALSGTTTASRFAALAGGPAANVVSSTPAVCGSTAVTNRGSSTDMSGPKS
jgi:hypothetical protein